MSRWDYWLLLVIFFLALGLRLGFVLNGYNIPFDYDQVEDIYLTKRIVVDHDLPIIGRAIYGNPNIHHGVVFFYFNIIPYVLFGGSALAIVYWICFASSLVVVVLYFFSYILFENKFIAFLTALLAAVSYEMVQYSVWISSTTLSVLTVPLCFLFLSLYLLRGKEFALPLSCVFLGLSIQSQLSFVYLIPVVSLSVIFGKRSMKYIFLSALLFLLSVSTMIVTELKLSFGGIRAFMHFSDTFSGTSVSHWERLDYYYDDLVKMYSLGLMGGNRRFGEWIFLLVVFVMGLGLLHSSKNNRRGVYFLFLILFSSAFMLLIGYHRKPWFLVGTVFAVPVTTSYLLGKIKPAFLVIPILIIVAIFNIRYIAKESLIGTNYFALEKSSLLSSQLEVVDFTYLESAGEPFAFNATTYPLYHNALWEYHYSWYGMNMYGYVPGWMGGDQVYPYKVLPKATENEKMFFVIVDNTYRIPGTYKNRLIQWADERGKMEKEFANGFTVQKRSVL